MHVKGSELNNQDVPDGLNPLKIAEFRLIVVMVLDIQRNDANE